MTIRTIEHGSADYEAMKALRLEVLLQPIGLTEAYINEENEKTEHLIGAFENERIIGCCVLTPRTTDTIQLRQMAVQTGVQGTGVGTAIVAFAEALSAERGYTFLLMHARNPVIGFYAKSGYQLDSEEFLEAGIGHHRMKKKLERR